MTTKSAPPPPVRPAEASSVRAAARPIVKTSPERISQQTSSQVIMGRPTDIIRVELPETIHEMEQGTALERIYRRHPEEFKAAYQSIRAEAESRHTESKPVDATRFCRAVRHGMEVMGRAETPERFENPALALQNFEARWDREGTKVLTSPAPIILLFRIGEAYLNERVTESGALFFTRIIFPPPMTEKEERISSRVLTADVFEDLLGGAAEVQRVYAQRLQKSAEARKTDQVNTKILRERAVNEFLDFLKKNEIQACARAAEILALLGRMAFNFRDPDQTVKTWPGWFDAGMKDALQSLVFDLFAEIDLVHDQPGE